MAFCERGRRVDSMNAFKVLFLLNLNYKYMTSDGLIEGALHVRVVHRCSNVDVTNAFAAVLAPFTP